MVTFSMQPPPTSIVRARATLVAGLALALTVVVSACGGGGASPADAGPDAPATSLCADDTRAQAFTPGMEASTGDRALRVRLLAIAPAPPSKGDENRWHLQVVDAAGAPLDGATISVKGFMPDHGHGTSIVPLVVASGSPGEYDVSRLVLFMPGIWQITITVTAAGVTESPLFTFCVAG
jgi:hypothetical protein